MAAPRVPASTEGARSAFRRCSPPSRGLPRPPPTASLDSESLSTGPSLYRHRPRTFADVVGQEHVVRTLRNAVEQGKVHHAYLFVGSRGTGKTSMAKILAACLNCERGPTIEPCGKCESCTSIASATSLDVIEMDAASNNSVDDIRELREKVAYAPVSGRHKVYILDEAHMLSSQAWNALAEDAGGAAAADHLRARHDRGPEGAPDRGRPLPSLRLRAPDRRAGCRGAGPGRRARNRSGSRMRRSRSSRAMPPGAFVTPSARSSSSSPTPARRRSPPPTCSPSWGGRLRAAIRRRQGDRRR